MTVPNAESGTEMRNQRATTARMVPKGTAPDEPAPIRKRSRRKMMTKMILKDWMGQS